MKWVNKTQVFDLDGILFITLILADCLSRIIPGSVMGVHY